MKQLEKIMKKLEKITLSIFIIIVIILIFSFFVFNFIMFYEGVQNIIEEKKLEQTKKELEEIEEIELRNLKDQLGEHTLLCTIETSSEIEEYYRDGKVIIKNKKNEEIIKSREYEPLDISFDDLEEINAPVNSGSFAQYVKGTEYFPVIKNTIEVIDNINIDNILSINSTTSIDKQIILTIYNANVLNGCVIYSGNKDNLEVFSNSRDETEYTELLKSICSLQEKFVSICITNVIEYVNIP